MNYEINDLNIYKGEGEIFLSNGDHYLLRITGDDSMILESILTEFKQSNSLENAYSSIENKLNREHFDNYINWLTTHRILKQEDKQNSNNPITKNIVIWGDLTEDENTSKQILNRLNGDKLRFSLNSTVYNDFNQATFDNCDLVLIFSPLFGNYESFQQLNKLCYELKIPMLHIGTGMNFLTIGPFAIPEKKTPCMKCYSKRKMINFNNNETYLKFIKLNGHQIISKNLLDNRYIGAMGEFLKIELENFFLHDNKYLLSKSITIDFLNYEISESKILRIPNCETCNPTSIVSPLN